MYYEERIRSIEILLQKPKNEMATGDIHKLRVELKKVRALAHLVRYCTTGFQEKKFMKPCMKIFKAAGSVRELQLQKARLKKQGAWTVLDQYAARVTKALKNAKHQFYSRIDNALLKKIKARDKMIVPYFNAVQGTRIARYLEMKSNEIDGLIKSPDLKEKQVHKLRSLLKEFHYTILMFQPGAVQLETIDALQELLGKWHDDVVLEACLKKAEHAGTLPHAETEKIERVEREMTAERNRLFEKIQLKLFNLQPTRSLLPVLFQ
jgi:CHAD domain-containing protein